VELRHLRYFVAVAEELNFSRAARRLAIAQPALSRQVAALEEAVGGPLFERSKRHVVLTEAGRLLLDEAQAAIAQAEKALAVGRSAAAGRLGLLSVAVSSTSMFNSQPPELLQRYRSEWPGVEIEIHEMWTAKQIAMLAAGQIDLGFQHIDSEFVRAGGTLERAGLLFEVLGSEGLVAALAGRKSLALQDLADEAFFVLPEPFAEGDRSGESSACAGRRCASRSKCSTFPR
jgi:DNA-binding transcriptional LysR family regulator